MGKQVILKGGQLLDIYNNYRFHKKEILIENGLISEIADEIKSRKDSEVVHLDNQIIAPGFIDIHTHVYGDRTSLGVEADTVGVYSGCTTIFDAGSAGAKNFNDFKEQVIKNSRTRVISLINIAYTGLEEERFELADFKNINLAALRDIVKSNKNHIKGIKARASASTVGKLGIRPIEIAKEISSELGLPLVVHIGNLPPAIEDVLNLLNKGDVITHCFHGKENGLLNDNRHLRRETSKAIDRGVLFDIGHGTSSFNFNVAADAIKQNFYPDIISTDIYRQNYKGPVYSLALTINKMMALGLNIEACISKVTTVPALNFKLDRIGMIKRGYMADFTVFNLIDKAVTLEDSDGNLLNNNKYLQVACTIKGGELINVEDNK
ncbi:amidohydrolase/deacetylase family metallohydrolase [Alkaliphilus peptidifermentans]|uniref:Dihydroorotase n=1 Tax=Alkaliphilus peptidifermentans DSM 18978 TaxID=1120976 RepID=A0A1G5ITL2_9FIRM|nr:amidohydrolase/deacetylase family metallohydrolase [Alkaliphilus peptidifermentans]SCY79080.1 dihydroorotase [Alkaliphilus peptidifermentans DSM 18978]